jgi:CDP-diacylglycerol--glycerol-3-phosphate 3-phosphatidyltransferase
MHMTPIPKKEKETFSDFLRRIFKNFLESIGGFLNKLGIKPNMVTATGLVGNLAAGALIGTGHIFWGGILAMIMGPMDALDGTMARLRGESGRYGAFVDSVTDRFSEIAIFGGLLVYFIQHGTWLDILLVFFATAGSLMVSYVRARAESLDYSAKIGLMSRAERYLVLIPGIIFNFPIVSLWILAVLANLTAIQRFWHVRRQAKQLEEEKED